STSPHLSGQTGTADAEYATLSLHDALPISFTNTTNIATIQVVKQVDGTQVAGWTIDASSPSAPMTVSPGSVTTVASGTSDFGLRLGGAAGSSPHIAEARKPASTAGAVSCAS